MKRVHLVIIDPQMDFCTPNGTHSGLRTGALFVPGADEDMRRLARMVTRVAPMLADIHITLDSHHLFDVSHPPFWMNSKGHHPAPFTIITATDLRGGVWTTATPSFRNRMIAYVEALERGGRYPLMVWPPHCLIGTPGHCVVPELMSAVNQWELSRRAVADFISKGSNIFTEHYSAVRAEVPDPNDPTTQPNTAFVQVLEEADLILWAGEASSHCVVDTIRDACEQVRPECVKKMVLLTDATSAVPGCDGMYREFLAQMTAKGLRTSTTTDVL